eukprot:gnl/Dysnectes_brevis/3109_a3866_890.p1 GENE.gnl/Dysnectes_brevis/3109_a3866_890~~gnl/Dysnectes_brevis/3109_a3866_890.p1  ORF type:complete len:336 (+),score=43.14 gnl/Dysnectes_brevis/3109_a3866_890:3-1010(+)
MDEQQEIRQVTAYIDRLIQENEFLMKENDLFQSFIERYGSYEQQDDHSSDEEPSWKMSLKPAESGSLGQSDKLLIVLRETEDLKDDLEQMKDKGSQLKASLKALTVSAEARMSESKRQIFELKRDVLGQTDPSRSTISRVPLEKVRSFQGDLTHSLESALSSAESRALSLRQQIKRAQVQLSHRSGSGAALHVIDYDQLRIENHQYLERIAERNQELLRLKLTTGNSVQVLNTMKAELAKASEERSWLEKEQGARREQLGRIATATKLAERQLSSDRATLRLLRQREIAMADGPQVMDYISLTAEETDLTKSVKEWRRKVEIQELRAGRTRHSAK